MIHRPFHCCLGIWGKFSERTKINDPGHAILVQSDARSTRWEKVVVSSEYHSERRLLERQGPPRAGDPAVPTSSPLFEISGPDQANTHVPIPNLLWDMSPVLVPVLSK